MPELKPSAVFTRNAGIDVLRGVSILLVLLHHIGLRIRLVKGVLGGYVPARILNALNFDGYEAVFLFFVISGFLITLHSLGRWGRLGAMDARAFYARRAARIVPCLLGLVAVLAALHLLGVPDYVIAEKAQSLPRAIGAALGLHLNWYEGMTGYLPASWDVLWSLSIEEVFYLGFPVACLLLRREWLMAPVLVGLAAWGPIALARIKHNPIWAEKAYWPGVGAIAVGVLAALVAARWRPRSLVLPRVLLAVGALGVPATLLFEDLLWPRLHEGTLLLLEVLTAALLLSFHGYGARRPEWKIPGTGWVQSFGRMSYEIYLTHMFVVMTVVELYKHAGAGPRWGLLWYGPALAGAWALGWAVTRWFSAPAERAVRSLLLKPRREAVAAGA